jgi:ribosomal protein S18 acetylase RimI-like enzyme
MPCGYVSVQYEGPDSEGVEVFHLHKIYVMPDIQGKGVGLRLFETATDHVRDAMSGQYARIELNVNKYNKAVDFYRHLGMRVLLEEDFPIGNGFYKTDYIMGLDVESAKNV